MILPVRILLSYFVDIKGQRVSATIRVTYLGHGGLAFESSVIFISIVPSLNLLATPKVMFLPDVPEPTKSEKKQSSLP